MNLRIPTAVFLLLLGGAAGALLFSLLTPAALPITSETHALPSPTVSTPIAPPPTTGQGQRTRDTPTPFHWSQLESADFKIYIANLRAIGCPEPTIHDIIRAEIDQLYETAYHELERHRDDPHFNYWERRRGPGPAAEYELHARHRKLDRDKEALFEELLGDRRDPEDAGEAPLIQTAETPARLPREIQDQVNEIQEKFHHLQDEIFHNADGEIYPDDALALQELRDQRLQELEAVLTPEQLREVELRESPTAEHMRHELVAFQPSEEEFRAIFDLRQQFDAEFAEEHFDFYDPEYGQAREDAERQMQEQIRELLGEERFAEYELANDHHYRDLHRLGERFDVPRDGIDQMFELWRDAERQVDQIHSNEQLTHEQKRLELQRIQQTVRSEAPKLLGEDGYYNYQARGGEWIEHLFEE